MLPRLQEISPSAGNNPRRRPRAIPGPHHLSGPVEGILNRQKLIRNAIWFFRKLRQPSPYPSLKQT